MVGDLHDVNANVNVGAGASDDADYGLPANSLIRQ